MRPNKGAWFAVLLFSACGGVGASAPPIQSTFDADVEGWTLEGFDTCNNDYALGQTMAQAAIWDPSGAAMRNETFVGITDYFVAPPKFTGDLSAYLGGTLTYEIRDSDATEPYTAALVILDCAGSRWRYDADTTAGLAYTPFSIPFDGSAGWTNIADGSTATADTFKAALVAVTGFRIRGEFSNAIDQSWLDNVVVDR